jgi:c-di-GMP-binding flagellar brake protein YcgR
MKLQVGARLQLMLARSQKSVYYSSLIGWVPNEYLLVKIPIDHGLSVPIQEGEGVTVRVFSGVAVFTFQTNIESVLLAPRYYMHLSFPGKITATPLRGRRRVKVNLPVEVRSAATEPKTAALVDLSLSGAFIHSEGPLGEPGGKVSLAFAFRVQPTNQEVRIETEATICSCREFEANGQTPAPFTHGTGVLFKAIAPGEQVMLQNFLYEAAENQQAPY